MQIGKHSVVAIHYTLTNPAGETIDSSEGREALTFLQGVGQLIPGLERQLEGKKAGDKLKAVVGPEEGYGVRDERAVQVVPRDSFKGVADLKEGMQFRAQGPQGQQQVVTIMKVEGDKVTVDGNHVLAGVTLTFDVTVVSVREATKEEVEHGHVHGEGGHHH